MDELLNSFRKLEVSKQQKVDQYVKDDLVAIQKAIIENPNKCDTQLIEFPPLLEQDIDLECLSIALQFLKHQGESYLLESLPYHLKEIAKAYLDYYIEQLEESYDYLSASMS